MKKLVLILTIFTVGSFTTLSAQIQEGHWMVGGEFAAANFGLNSGAGYNLQVTPQVAYFVLDNWAVGPYIKLGVSGAKNINTTFNYGIGALSRYYFSPGEQGVDGLLKRGSFFIEGNAGIGGTTTNGGGASTNGLDLGIGPGYTYFITKDIGLDASLKLNNNLGFGNKTSTSDISFRLGLNIFLPTRKGLDNFKSE